MLIFYNFITNIRPVFALAMNNHIKMETILITCISLFIITITVNIYLSIKVPGPIA